ncbi:MAG: hypothetical protein HY721_09440 [Planctomycetes bacterium]|nr:hypothetical protein [Planctomycetota bacterium]
MSTDSPKDECVSPTSRNVALLVWLATLGAMAFGLRAAASAFEQTYKDLAVGLPAATVLVLEVASGRSPLGIAALATAVAVPLLLYFLRPHGSAFRLVLRVLAVAAFLWLGFSILALFLPLREIIKPIR